MSRAGSWMGGMMPMGGGMMIIGLAWLVLLLAVGAAIVWLIVRGRGRQTDRDARQVLDVRYAGGELDRETYLRRRDDLAGHAPASR